MDSTEVSQAKAYGAIILAHGNMAEWAFTNAISIGSGMHLTFANAVRTWCTHYATHGILQLWLLGSHWVMQHSACFPSHLRSAVLILLIAAQQGLLCLLPPEVMCMLNCNVS